MEITSTSPLRISVLGGSNSVMPDGYVFHLKQLLSDSLSQELEFKNYSLGAIRSLFGTTQNVRKKIATKSDVILFEFCVNDRDAIWSNQSNLQQSVRALEGFIRSSKEQNPGVRIIILDFGYNSNRFYS